jgi:gliding motility-associated protein GldL
MMSISELVETTAWKKFIAKLYGWGASVVIVGALFKIQHWPGASIMLMTGMLLEAVIFFFSAFEPVHEELDWTLVYPELAGLTDDDDMEAYKENVIGKRGNTVLERFDSLVSETSISEESINRVGEGLQKLGSTASKISDISEATAATQTYVNNFRNAAQTLDSMTVAYSENTDVLKNSVSSLAGSYQKAAGVVEQSGLKVAETLDRSSQEMEETVKVSISALTGSYQKVAGAVEQSGQKIASTIGKSSDDLANTYEKLTQSMSVYYGEILEGGKSYNNKLDKLGLSLDQLNTLYELQLKGTQEHLKETESLYSGMSGMIKNLQSSVEETEKYKAEIAKLSQNLSNLNNIYGNMLSAMNVVKR